MYMLWFHQHLQCIPIRPSHCNCRHNRHKGYSLHCRIRRFLSTSHHKFTGTVAESPKLSVRICHWRTQNTAQPKANCRIRKERSRWDIRNRNRCESKIRFCTTNTLCRCCTSYTAKGTRNIALSSGIEREDTKCICRNLWHCRWHSSYDMERSVLRSNRQCHLLCIRYTECCRLRSGGTERQCKGRTFWQSRLLGRCSHIGCRVLRPNRCPRPRRRCRRKCWWDIWCSVPLRMVRKEHLWWVHSHRCSKHTEGNYLGNDCIDQWHKLDMLSWFDFFRSHLDTYCNYWHSHHTANSWRQCTEHSSHSKVRIQWHRLNTKCWGLDIEGIDYLNMGDRFLQLKFHSLK